MTNKSAPDLGIQLGRVFEVGFNIGLLTYFQQVQWQNSYGDIYRNALEQLELRKIAKKLAENCLDPAHKNIIKDWVKLFLQKGWTSGLSFIKEYREATGWRSDKRVEIIYFQCDFYNDNAFGTSSRDSNLCYQEMLENQGFNQVDISHYKNTGEFLKADTLLFLKYLHEYRILVVDLSVFSTAAIREVTELQNIPVLLQSLQKELKYIRSKSRFCDLTIDTGNTVDQDHPSFQQIYSPKLTDFFKAFTTKDKESMKVIQACSYAWSFYEFLRRSGKITESDQIKFNCFGYSDRLVNGIAVTKEPNSNEGLEILQNCYHIYRQKLDIEATEAREKLLKVIKIQAGRCFTDGRTFVKQIVEAKVDDITEISHQETWVANRDFFNTADNLPDQLITELNLEQKPITLRDAHAQLISRALTEKNQPFLFLTGNPGIGKTTAIAEHIINNIDNIGEGNLLIYVSPRLQVNRDMIEKFSVKDSEAKKLRSDQLICLNISANTLENLPPENSSSRYAVEYLSNLINGEQKFGDVQFIDAKLPLNQQHQFQRKSKRISDQSIESQKHQRPGVLDNLAQGIYTCINHSDLPKNIIATVAMQALKGTEKQNTLKYLDQIFHSAYNSRKNQVIPDEMKAIQQKIPNIFIMIDEITGSAEGVHFLEGVCKWVEKYDLLNPDYRFNLKIIIADASLTSADVVKSHLSKATFQLDKIFFRSMKKSTGTALSLESFTFLNKPAILINANSFPASELIIQYQIFIKSISSDAIDTRDVEVLSESHQKMESDIMSIIDKNDGQIIVYIQNKDRLKKLIESIREKRQSFVIKEEYIEIHADLGEKEKREVHLFIEDVKVKVVFITSSASRGLSFPKTKYILVDIARFQIEQNLMEIIQVIYRGRGGNLDQGPKYLTFYLNEVALYYADSTATSDREKMEKLKISLQESCLNVLNILIILKTAIMTRIKGAGKISSKDYAIIPIGGTALSQTSGSLINSMATLLRKIRQEYQKKPQYKKFLQDIEKSLKELLEVQRTEISRDQSPDQKRQHKPTIATVNQSSKEAVSYLSIGQEILSAIERSWSSLLDLPPIEKTYIRGSLLIVPLSNKVVKEINYVDLDKIIDPQKNSDFRHKLWSLAISQEYSQQITKEAKNVIDLVSELGKQMERSQAINQTTKFQNDRYYALPIQTFIVFDALKEYFADQRRIPDEKDNSFRDILKGFAQTIASAQHILPINSNYQDIPYIVFHSNIVDKLGKNLFNENQLFQSSEISILNLILSQE